MKYLPMHLTLGKCIGVQMVPAYKYISTILTTKINWAGRDFTILFIHYSEIRPIQKEEYNLFLNCLSYSWLTLQYIQTFLLNMKDDGVKI